MISRMAASQKETCAPPKPFSATCFGHDEFLGYLELLEFRVAGHLDHLHAVEEGVGDAVERVGGRYEHHVREVVGELEVVVREARVLLGIEDLEEGARGVAAEVRGHLVHLVEEEDGIARARLAYRLDDLARQGPDVGLAVAADLGLVADAPEAHSHEGAIEGAGHRAAERGLARARRPYETEDRPARAVGELPHRDELEYALLGLLHPVVILVEGRAGPGDISVVPALGGPRQVGEPLAVDPQYAGLRREGLELPEARELAPGLCQDLFGGRLGEEVLLKLLDLGILAVLAKLAVDLFELLAQEILALIAVDAVLDLGADLALQVHELGFALDRGLHGLESL